MVLGCSDRILSRKTHLAGVWSFLGERWASRSNPYPRCKRRVSLLDGDDPTTAIREKLCTGDPIWQVGEWPHCEFAGVPQSVVNSKDTKLCCGYNEGRWRNAIYLLICVAALLQI
jgi:hypothetical protein